jgi:GAF domain-containing protein
MTDDRLLAAAAAGSLGSEAEHRALLQGIVEVARAIFGSQAASVFLYDDEADELVFEAVSGEGEGDLIGRRFPSSTGIAGWVLVTRQQLVVDDARTDERFGRGGGREVAESTGYVPNKILAVPLLHEEEALGVLEVLDPPAGRRDPLADMELLSLFAGQAAAALALLRRARKARAVLDESEGSAALVARIAGLLEERDDAKARKLLEALAEVLETR